MYTIFYIILILADTAGGRCMLEMTNKKGYRRNFMSYMVVIKNVNGIVMASDSYSTYPDRTLKDSNYKKIHEIIPNILCIGITGINQVYVGKELVDINGTLLEYFRAV